MTPFDLFLYVIAVVGGIAFGIFIAGLVISLVWSAPEALSWFFEWWENRK